MNVIILLTLYSLQIFTFSKVCGTRISQSKCDDYRNMLTPISEISNGRHEIEASKVFPFMVHIYDDNGAYSNGILISENFVLTIANNGTAKYIILGHHSTHTDDAHLKSFEVLKEIQHFDFNIDPNQTIKLLMLEKSLQFNAYIRPACLTHSKSNIPKRLIEIGWNGTSIKTIRKVKLSSILTTKCLEEMATGEHYIRRIEDRTHFCAVAVEGELDVCHGFDGAALLNDDGMASHSAEIVGIASMNSVCGNWRPHIYVNLSKYISWIEDIVWPSSELNESDHAEKKSKREKRESDDEVSEIESKVETSDPPNPTSILTNSLASTSVKPGLNSLVTVKQAINETQAPPSLPESNDETRKIVFIFMLVIVFILLIVCGVLALCVEKYKAKNRRSIGV